MQARDGPETMNHTSAPAGAGDVRSTEASALALCGLLTVASPGFRERGARSLRMGVMRLFARFKHPRRWLLGLAGVVLVGAAFTGVAWATIPGEDGVIHGCYLRSGGTLRVIDASVTNCKRGEVALNWNVSGPQGPPGPTGSPGAGYTEFRSGEGGAGAITLPEPPNDPVQILQLDLPSDWASDGQGGWRQGVTGLVATVSVLFRNNGPVMAHPGCTVLSDTGGLGDGHMYITGTDYQGISPTTATMTFQSTTPSDMSPPSELYLVCVDGQDHEPLPEGTSMNVEVLTAMISVVPRAF